MIVVVVILVVLAVVLIGGAVLVLRSLRYLPVHRFAVATRKWGWPRTNLSREEYLLRRTLVVRGGQTVPMWSWLYDIEEHDYITIPPGTVGLVRAKIGAHVPAGRQLAKHIECDHFQDVRAFLENRGEQGVQPELLRGGEEYAIDPQLFEVYTVDTIPEGLPIDAGDLRLVSVDAEDVGVVIVTDAPAPDDLSAPAPPVPDHDNFQRPWEFLGNNGRSGPQTGILPGGATYAINPMFARVVHIPTRELTLTWGAKSDSEDRYDSELAPLRVTIQGFDLEVELTQTLSIPPHAAPYLVKRFGEDADGDVGDRKSTAVKRFVGRVLGEKVKGYFTERTSGGEIDKFIHELADVREKLKIQVSKALAELHVDARETTIGEIRFASDDLNEEYRKYVRLQQRYQQLEQELSNQRVDNDVEREKLKVAKEQYIAQEQALSDLYGLDHRRLERMKAIEGNANQPHIILAGGAPNAIPTNQLRHIEGIVVPEFDPTAELDMFGISPGVLPSAGRTEPDDSE